MKNHYHRMVLAATIFFASFLSFAQNISDYTFSQTNGTYTPLTGGTILRSYTGTTGVASLDNFVDELPAGTIPFNFQFGSNTFTGLFVSGNGFISFGSTNPGTANYAPLSATTAYLGAIGAFTRDLQGGWVTSATRTLGSAILTDVADLGLAQVGDLLNGTGIPTGATIAAISGNTITMSAAATSTGTLGPVQIGGAWSNVQYGVVGSAPNRVFVVEYNNMKRFGSTLTTAQHMRLNFQIRLYETSNKIEVVYGNCSPGLTNFATINQVGLRGPSNDFATSVNARMNTKGVNDNWLNSSPATANSSGMIFNDVAPSNVIPLGLTYTWLPPSCLGPTNLLVSSLTSNSVDLTWNASNSNPSEGYQWELRTSGAPGSGASGLVTSGDLPSSTLTANFNTLLPQTQYFFYIRSNCGNNDLSNWALTSFTTACVAVTEFIENFDSQVSGTTGTFPICWGRITTATNGVYIIGSTVAPLSPPNRLYMSASGTANPPTFSLAITPAVSNLQANTHRLRFRAFATTANQFIEVGYMSNPTDAASFVPVTGFTLPSPAAQAAEFTYIPTGIPAGVQHLAFRNQGSPTGSAFISIDDVRWELNSSCQEPSNLTIVNGTNTTAILGWTNNGTATTWEIEYGAPNFQPGGGTLIPNITTNPYELTGLTQNTNYWYYVRAICDGNVPSSWSGPFAFTTQCDDVTEFLQDFDNETSGTTGTFPTCWGRLTTAANGVYVIGSTVAPLTPPNRLYLSASGTANPPTVSVAIAPPVSNLQAETHRFKFKAFATTANQILEVGYMTNPYDRNSFVPVTGYTLPSPAAQATEFTFIPTNIPAGVKHLAYRNQGSPTGSAFISIDDVIWEQIPSCEQPSGLSASNATTTTADLSWTASAPFHSAWNIEYGIEGFTQGQGTVINAVTNPYTLTGLAPSTTYEYYVQTNCGTEGNSLWAGPFSFNTACLPADMVSTQGDVICGEGTATLSATPASGAVLWYESQTSLAPIFEGNTFTTPIINQTTSFWAATASGGSVVPGQAKPAPTGTAATSGANWGLIFTLNSPITLVSVDVFLTGAAGNLTVELTDLNGVVLQQAVIPTPAGGTTTAPIQFTVPLGFSIDPGSYRIVTGTGSPNMIRDTTGNVFPYPLGTAGQITSGFITGTSQTYYWFYNWTISTACVGPRQEVVATVTQAPSIEATVSDAVICAGEQSTLSVTSANADYTYEWMPGNLLGASVNVTPTLTTTYTVTATDANTGCVISDAVTVTVNPVPATLTVETVSYDVCEDQIVELSAVGISPPSQIQIGDGIVANVISTPFRTNWGGIRTEAIYTATELAALGLVAGDQITSIGWINSSTNITNPLTLNDFSLNVGWVSEEFITTGWNGNANIVVFPTGTLILGPLALDQPIDFTLPTPIVWDGVSNLLVATCFNNNDGGGGDPNIGVRSTNVGDNRTRIFNADNNPNVCSSLTSTNNVNRPNLRVSSFSTSEITWSPVTNLFVDEDAVIPYTQGEVVSTVYFKSQTAGSFNVIATATNIFDCSISDDVTIVVNETPATPVATAQEFCDGATVADLIATIPGVQQTLDETSFRTTDSALDWTLTQTPIVTSAGGYAHLEQLTSEIVSPVFDLTGMSNVEVAFSVAKFGTGVDGPVTISVSNDGGSTWTAQEFNSSTPTSATYINDVFSISATGNQVRFKITRENSPSAKRFRDFVLTGTSPATGSQVLWFANEDDTTPLDVNTLLASGVYYAAQENSLGCISENVAVNVTINVTPTPMVEDQLFCNAATVSDLIAQGVNVLWYEDLTSTTPLADSFELVSGTYFVSQTIDGCESERATVVISIQITDAPLAEDQTFCSGVTVADLVAQGTDLQWYVSETAETALEGTEVLQTGSYFVSQTVNGCESVRTEITVTVNITDIPEVSSQAFCQEATVADLTAIGDNIQWYASLTSDTALALDFELSTGTYFATQTINGCESARFGVEVTVLIVEAPVTETEQELTEGSTVADLIATGSDIQWFANEQDALDGVNALDPTTLLVEGTYYVVQSVNGCPSVAVAVNVSIVLSSNAFDFTSLKYHPNPVLSVLNIQYSEVITSVEVYNLLGQKVMIHKPLSTNATLDMSELTAATYMIKVQSGEVEGIIKVVKR